MTDTRGDCLMKKPGNIESTNYNWSILSCIFRITSFNVKAKSLWDSWALKEQTYCLFGTAAPMSALYLLHIVCLTDKPNTCRSRPLVFIALWDSVIPERRSGQEVVVACRRYDTKKEKKKGRKTKFCMGNFSFCFIKKDYFFLTISF